MKNASSLSRIFISFLLFLTLNTPDAAAEDLTRWTTFGAEAKSCTKPDGGWCVTLTCGQDGTLLFRANGPGFGPGTGIISVDRRQLGQGQFGGQQNSSWVMLNPQSNQSILSAMASGSRLGVSIRGSSVDVSLRGSSAAIAHVLEQCTRKSPPPVVMTADKTQLYERHEDEQKVAYREPDIFNSFSTHRDMDIWGGDIRSGMNDPALAGITREECAQLCLMTEGCGAYTFNMKNGDVCFLKTGAAKMRRYAGAISGVRATQEGRVHPPATRGPLPVVNEAVAWRDGEAVMSRQQRTRAAAVPLGRSCAEERADLEALAQNLVLSLKPSQVEAGKPVTLRWSGNTLTERIPVWLSFSSSDPVRFDGSAAMVLGPEAPAPFGMQTAAGSTRALVSLWGRGAGKSGQIQILPPLAQPVAIDVYLVAWLRQCQQELPLRYIRFDLDVTPAQASLVIGTPASRADMTYGYDSVAYNRRIEFGSHRFRIVSLENGVEIIERDGQNLRLSPTERFLLSGGEVIDILDGVTVATVRSPSHWMAGDSFLFGSTAPWGTSDLASTFGGRQLITSQITAPSCCLAEPEDTHLALDLENGLVTLRGPIGHSVGPIQGRPYAFEDAPNGYAASQTWGPAVQAEALYALGPVSPIATALGFNAPDVVPVGPELRDRATPINPSGSKEEIVVASLFRGAGSAAVSAFERIGIELLEGIPAQQKLAPLVGQAPERTREEVLSVLATIRPEAGWLFDVLPTPAGITLASDCFYYLHPDGAGEADPSNPPRLPTKGALAVPQIIRQLAVIDTGDMSLLLGSMECQAGATFGSLRGQSYFFSVPIRTGAQPGLLVDHAVLGDSYFGNARVTQFQDFSFHARLFGDRVLAHNGRGGRMVLFDAGTNQVIQDWSDLTAGGLLIDAFMTRDRAHVVQMNSDGGFFAYRIGDGTRVLSGRVVDDEVAVWTDDFRYDATAEAASLIDLRFPGMDEQFSLDRFGAQLAVPGLSQIALGGAELPDREVPIPPDLSGRILVDGDTIVGSVELNPDRNASALRVYQGGVLTKVHTLQTGARFAEVLVSRLPGTRHVSILSVDANGLASNAITADLGKEHPGGVRRALAVAVDRYNDASLADLNYAKADADRFIQTLKALPAEVPGYEEPRFVGGRRAVPETVLSAIDETLAGLGPADHATLFFAGHGLKDADGNFYLALSGTDVSDLSGTAVPWAEIAKRLASAQARITILIDACHSGAAGAGLLATNDGAVLGLSSVPSNLTIFAASKGRQQSIEARSQFGGLFTVAFERILLRERDAFDQNGNGRIEASELAAGLGRIVSTQSEGRQVPWMTKGRVVGDYALF